jgi:putative membrane protein
MPSERRLHPLSFVFQVGGQLRQFVVPGIVLLVGAGSAGFGFETWLLALLIPSTLIALVRSLSVRYRFDPGELVIASGFIFRNERHVPYARIQNIDAVQNLAHRLFGVVEVRVETGGGDEPEASLRVLPRAALDEMRERVFAGRTASAAGADVAAASSPGPPDQDARTLLKLRARDLLLAGFIESRGLIIVSAAVGVLWEAGLFDPTLDAIAGRDVDGRGFIRQAFRAIAGGGMPSLDRVALVIAGFVLLLLLMRVLSMVWSLVRLYGFRLERRGEDLRAEFGLLTRVMTTVPIRRVQTLTIREGPLHRLFASAMVRVDTAGGETVGQRGAAKRESLAPLVAQSALPSLLREVLPDVDLSAIAWQPVDSPGFRRALRVSLIFYALLTLPFVLMLKWWTLALLAAFWLWSWLDVTREIRGLGWALVDGGVLFRSGWIVKEVSVARFSKLQAVTLTESPFDRRHRMASVDVDTAGAGDLDHRMGIPFLARATADDLRRDLTRHAAQTSFRW